MGAGVYAFGRGTKGRFVDCEIQRNEAENVDVADYADPSFAGCKIYRGKSSGIRVSDGGKGRFTNCEVFGHVPRAGGKRGAADCPIGIYVNALGNPHISGCHIYDNKCGVFVDSAAKVSLSTLESLNRFSGNEAPNVDNGLRAGGRTGAW